MASPQISRPIFPEGYLRDPGEFLNWSEVEARLRDALHYWLCSVRPDGRPHAVPKWMVLVKGKLFFDGSPETRHARNIALNPAVNVHLEDGAAPLILEGRGEQLGPPPAFLAGLISAEYQRKYARLGYSPEPDQWSAGDLFQIEIDAVIAWTGLMKKPTKFSFIPQLRDEVP